MSLKSVVTTENERLSLISEGTSEVIRESGFSRIVQIMSGQVPSVRSFGVVTAENPMRQKLSPEVNAERNEKLRSYLKDSLYGFVQIRGKYDNWENPFFIMNISREELVTLGKRYDQESVLFAERTTAGKEANYDFYLINPQDGSVISHRTAWKSKGKFDKKNDEDNMFSLYKGRKFNIPFFDDVSPTESLKEYCLSTNLVNVDKWSYSEDELLSEELQKLKSEVLRYQDPGVGYNGWVRRGVTLRALNEISRKLGY